MAQEVQIAGTPAKAKIRSIWAVPILSIVTVGIYYFCWYYFINREMRDLGRARGNEEELGDSPGKSLLAVTLGALIIVPAIISLIHTGRRIQAAQRTTGVDPTMNGWLAVVMYIIFSPVMLAYWQSELNKVWGRAGDAPRLSEAETVQADAASGLGTGPATPSTISGEPPAAPGQAGTASTPPPPTDPPA